MLAYILRRLAYGLITLFALSAVVFFLIQASGSPLTRLRGNPRMAPVIPMLTEYYGLDRSVLEQYLTWLRNFVSPDTDRIAIHGIAPLVAIGGAIAYTAAVFVVTVRKVWWRSFRAFSILAVWLGALWFAKGRIEFALAWSVSFAGNGSVWDLIFGAAGATFRLGLTALAVALVVGISLGVYQAIRQYSFFDQLGTTFAFVAFSTPIFIVGVGLQIVFALKLEQWTGVKTFYVAGMTSSNYDTLGDRIQFGPIDLPSLQQFGDILQHLVLPALAIALISIAQYSRFQRASMLEVMHSDYLRTAKAKGLPRRTVIVKHALRTAMIPIVTLVSLDVAAIVGGAIITESIFGWPGIGRLYINAINSVDYPVIMAVVMVIGIGIVVMNIVADILYGVLDPRVRYD